jgi:hypothetical protein
MCEYLKLDLNIGKQYLYNNTNCIIVDRYKFDRFFFTQKIIKILKSAIKK